MCSSEHSQQKRCLCRYDVPADKLQFVPDELWKSEQMHSWTLEEIQFVLDSAEALLIDSASSLRVPVSVCFTYMPRPRVWKFKAFLSTSLSTAS